MTEATTLYIIRHGKTMFNTIGRTQGWSDTPLTKQGEEGIYHLGLGLRDIDFRKLIVVIVVVPCKPLRLFYKNIKTTKIFLT